MTKPVNRPKVNWQLQRSLELGEEIAWLRSFGWPDIRIAARLGVTEECLKRREFPDRVKAREDAMARYGLQATG